MDPLLHALTRTPSLLTFGVSTLAYAALCYVWMPVGTRRWPKICAKASTRRWRAPHARGRLRRDARPAHRPDRAPLARAVPSRSPCSTTIMARALHPAITTGPFRAFLPPERNSLKELTALSAPENSTTAWAIVRDQHSDGAYDYQADVAPRNSVVSAATRAAIVNSPADLEVRARNRKGSDREGGVTRARISTDDAHNTSCLDRWHRPFNLKIADLTPAASRTCDTGRRAGRKPDSQYCTIPRNATVHQIVVWAPDGKRVFFVTNREIPWGTGWICSVAAEGGEPTCLDKHQLETSWAARPEVAPDGLRILFSNYHGAQWHQLWLTTTDDTAPLPLTYGEFDRRNARGSRRQGASYTSATSGQQCVFVSSLRRAETGYGRRRPRVARLCARFLVSSRRIEGYRSPPRCLVKRRRFGTAPGTNGSRRE